MFVYGFRLPGMSSLILWGLLWEAIGQSGLTFFLPPLSEVLATLFEIIGTPAFQKALAETAQAFLSGVFFAVVIGIPVGILMGKNRLVDELLLPWVNIFLSAPLTALVPVLMVLFGFGMKSIIITTTLFAIWIIILNARAGVMQINRSLVEMASSFGASPWAAFTKVYFWAALPEILGGVRNRRDPRRQGSHHRPIADFNCRIWSLVRTLFRQFPDVAFLGCPGRALRACLHDLRIAGRSGAPCRLLRRKAIGGSRISCGVPGQVTRNHGRSALATVATGPVRPCRRSHAPAQPMGRIVSGDAVAYPLTSWSDEGGGIWAGCGRAAGRRIAALGLHGRCRLQVRVS